MGAGPADAEVKGGLWRGDCAVAGPTRQSSAGWCGATALSAGLRGLDLEDLELERAARCRDLDDLALLVAEDRLADRRLVRELVLRRVGLCGADDVVLDRLVRVHVL